MFFPERLFTTQFCELISQVPEHEGLECSLRIPELLRVAFDFEIEAIRTDIEAIRQETGRAELIPGFLEAREAESDNV